MIIVRPQQASTPQLRVYLLGGFRVELDGVPLSDSAWQMRRTARTLLKLLACEPRHSLHRDQVLELLWPDADPDSAGNSLSKALHAARHALEPESRARGQSAYLHLRNDVLMLDTEHVWIDIDHFQHLAHEALQRDDVASFEKALAAYPGDLLPEDRYQTWAAERGARITELSVRLLNAGADALEREGAVNMAVEWLCRALERDETREDIHRRLMRLYLRSGERHRALRQYDQCREILLREVDAEPEPETQTLHEDIRTNRVAKYALDDRSGKAPSGVPPLLSKLRSLSAPLIGRDRVLQRLQDEMGRAEQGNGGVILMSGEAGVGKTRLIGEFANKVVHRGVLVLWGTSSVHDNVIPYGPFAEALESYVDGLATEERKGLAARYPELVRLLPSLSRDSSLVTGSAGDSFDQTRLFPTIVCFLTELAWKRSLLLVLSDLHIADSSTVQLLQYLSRLAIRRHWLIIGSYREEDIPSGSELWRMLRATSTARLCRIIELRCLARQDCGQLVAALLPEGNPGEVLLEHLYALSLGNPLFIEEMIRTMRERDELTLVDGSWRLSSATLSVPRQVQNLVEDSVAYLDEDVQRVLTLAAVADARFTLRDLRGAAASLTPPIAENVLLDALDKALEARILEECDGCYGFRLPLFRATLREHLSRHRRVQFQSALTHQVEELVPQRNGHGDSNRRGKEQDAGMLSLAEVDSLAQHLGPSRAAAVYGDLVDRLDHLGLSAESSHAREKLASALISTAKYDRAVHVLSEASQFYGAAGDQPGLARTGVLTELARSQRVNYTDN
jgi:DNA-binding SARP family transcriptional activator